MSSYDNSPTVHLIDDVSATNVRRQRIFYRTLFYTCVVLLVIALLILWLRPYQYLIFSQMYPIGMCACATKNSKSSCTPPSSPNPYAWTIHGIWPASYDFNPQFCNMKNKFSMDAITSIESELNQQMPSVMGKNSNFWKHEWEKHGTCALGNTPLQSELKYFQQALEWNKKYPIEDFLSASGITPSDDLFDRFYSLDRIESAIGSKVEAVVKAQCDFNRKRNIYILTEVRICFSINLELIDCDDAIFSKCPEDKIYYPASTSI